MDSLKSGDVLLFYHSAGALSNTIRWATGSWVSHVGVVIKDPPGYRGLFLIESSLEKTHGIRGEPRFGVQVQPLRTVLSQYDQTWVRRLTPLQGGDCTKALWAAETPVDGEPYDWRPLDWIAAAIDNWAPNAVTVRRDDAFWCSALAAYLYIRLGYLDSPKVDWSLVSPGQWLEKGDREGRLEFTMCSLSPELRLDTESYLNKPSGADVDLASRSHRRTS